MCNEIIQTLLYMKFTKDKFVFEAPSRRQHKKYDVFQNDKYITSFGDNRYEQYHDKIGYYKSLNHGDKKRRDNYYSRHGEARFHSAKWFSHKYLW